MTDKKRVLLLGATGLFGGLLAGRIVKEDTFELVAAGRGEKALREQQAELGNAYRILNRDDADSVKKALTELKPFAVVDCAGPFQYYGDDPYRFARQVIEAGAHYIDIADSSSFVTGFSVLDDLACDKGVAAVTGASSTPAISAAVLDHLTEHFSRVFETETIIIPGNKAKRTFSVMKAILGQVGQPFMLWRYGQQEKVHGWSETRRYDLAVQGMPQVKGRLAAFVETPDIALFPERYKADTVLFKAGLEVKPFHHALALGHLLVRYGVIKSLAPFASLARWIASGFEWMGSDVGGMKVRVVGRGKDNTILVRTWDLIAGDGIGPNIPTLPVSALLDKLAQGKVSAGARPSTGEVTLQEVETQLERIGAATQIHDEVFASVFERALGDRFASLPEPVQALHSGFGRRVYKGEAEVKGPSGILGWVASRCFGFPQSGRAIPVTVTFTADQQGEKWVRSFAGKEFKSCLFMDDNGKLNEKLGPFTAQLGLKVDGRKLRFPVVSARLFGWLPIPMFLFPESIAHETVDDQGRFNFDILLKFRFGGRIAHYRGWLVPDAA